jgi:hypothetical protein
MALHLGNSENLKLYINGILYSLNIFSSNIEKNIRLLSSEGYVLKDVEGLYLVPKGDEPIIRNFSLLSSEGYVLKDAKELYLIPKEE